ncbi:MAG: DsbA family oxidoreductase [Betaproteobacteria bacterium]
MTVSVEVVSDVVCPWCYIGKRRLEQALELLASEEPGLAVDVVWSPFQLNPQLPAEGIARTAYLAQKFGAGAPQVYERVSEAGRSVGIDFAFDRIVRQPNTVPAHQLIDLARKADRQDAMVETLFRAYFLDGKDLSQTDNLVALAQAAGLDGDAAREALRDAGHRKVIIEQDEQARALGVSGVPFFIFARQLAVSGAQEAAVLVRAMREAATASASH